MKHIYRIFFLALLFCGVTKSAAAIGHTVNLSGNNILCFGSCTGTASSSVTGGVGPFTYLWAPGNQTTSNVTGLCAGTYTLTVTDQNDMSTATGTITITQPTQLTVTPFNVIPASCGNMNGQVCANLSGGTGPYTYLWSTGATWSCINNLTAGAYTVTVTDSNGCTAVTSTTVPNIPGPTVGSITVNPMSICNGGSAVLTPTMCCGTAPYTYQWTNPGFTLNNPNAYSPTATPSVTTSYTFTVTDANGCTANGVGTVNVGQSITANLNTVDATCNQSNGSITANVTAGAAPFTYNWSNAQTTSAINNLAAGQYSVTITAANGCSLMLADGVSNIGGPSVSISLTPTGCTNSSNGSAAANVTGIAPFTYLWNTNPVQTTPTANGLWQGSYLVTVTDSVGCVTVSPAQVNPLAGNFYMYANWYTPDNCSNNTGSVHSYVSGGTSPYSYQWSNGDTTANTTGLAGGLYSLTVTDFNGCIVSGNAVVPSWCGNYVSGRVYLDMNQNGAFDAGDFPVPNSPVTISPYSYNTLTDAQGVYWSIITVVDTFTVIHNPPHPNYSLVSPSSGNHLVIFATIGDTSLANDFVYTVPGPFQDLYLSLASGFARPGWPQQYSIHAENRGTTIVSDTIWFRHDSILSLINASPPFDGYTYPVGYWLFSNFAPLQQINKTVIMQVPTLQNGGYIGRNLFASAGIEPTSPDTTPTDNGDDEHDVITGSYDPNLKECWSPTMNAAGDIWPADLTLDYTIHFQNSGTDTAFFVIVVDTLPAELDITTFRMGASSHPCTYSVNGSNGINEVKFTFMNILLPDSNINEPASHGFCQFTIDRFANLPIGTQIMNEANNYFDFNPAIVTNMDTVTIWDPLSVAEASRANVLVYPNPAQDNVNILLSNEFTGSNSTVTLRDISGRTIATMQTNGATQVVLNTENCSAGMYFITVELATEETYTQQLIISEK